MRRLLSWLVYSLGLPSSSPRPLSNMTLDRRLGVFFSALVVALGGIVYELVIGSTATVLLGNSIVQFSLTIGFMLFGMGLGAFLSPYLRGAPEARFVLVELALSVLGGFAPLILMYLYTLPVHFLTVFIVYVIAVGVLIGLEIPIMYQILSGDGGGVKMLSRILTFDYIGALLASLLFPLLLLPWLGLIRSALFIGALNAIVAALILIAFRQELGRYTRVYAVICVCVVMVVSLGFVRAQALSAAVDGRLFQDPIVYSQQSLYQKIVLTKFRDDVRLYLDGNLQLSSIDEYRYHEALVHVPIAVSVQPMRVLILGGGDGLVAREVLRYADIDHVTLVDLDPAVTELASSYPDLVALNEASLMDARVRVIHGDAMKFLEESSELYDMIIADLPDPNNESLAKLYSQSFYRLIRARLTVDGVFVTQATSPFFSPSAFWMIDRTVASVGFSTLPYHVNVPSFGEWGFVLAKVEPLMKPSFPPAGEYRYLTEGTWQALFDFAVDTQPTPQDTRISTLVEPKILDAYLTDAKRWQP